MENIEKDVKEVIAAIVKRPIGQISDSANLYADFGVDSLLGVEIFAALDKKFHVDIPEKQLSEVRTVADVIELVKNLKK